MGRTDKSPKGPPFFGDGVVLYPIAYVAEEGGALRNWPQYFPYGPITFEELKEACLHAGSMENIIRLRGIYIHALLLDEYKRWDILNGIHELDQYVYDQLVQRINNNEEIHRY